MKKRAACLLFTDNMQYVALEKTGGRLAAPRLDMSGQEHPLFQAARYMEGQGADRASCDWLGTLVERDAECQFYLGQVPSGHALPFYDIYDVLCTGILDEDTEFFIRKAIQSVSKAGYPAIGEAEYVTVWDYGDTELRTACYVDRTCRRIFGIRQSVDANVCTLDAEYVVVDGTEYAVLETEDGKFYDKTPLS